MRKYFKRAELSPIWGILGFAVFFTIIVAATASRLKRFDIVGPTEAFQYPWRLLMPNSISLCTAWLGYAAHNLCVFLIIAWAQRQKANYRSGFRAWNWALVVVHLFFVLMHGLQSHLYYDALAASVPEVTALGSVALMLMVVLILESPRRGLFFGRSPPFSKRFIQAIRQYHGYLFSWAVIYTFWYHPAEATPGHLIGFFYIFLLLGQSALIFNRAHINRWWTLSLELMVLPHGVMVALYQPNSLWPMFCFGFGAIFIITQIYGLPLRPRQIRFISVCSMMLVFAVYALMGRLAALHEVIRIPVLDYGVVFMLWAVFWLWSRLVPKYEAE